MGISISSNLASLNAQRRLSENTQRLDSAFTRLSSGLRINKASDDAAGLAISQSLQVDARVFSQGIRNLNDGLSMLNIAEGALSEVTNIVVRLQELASQSANGTLTNKQRTALGQEANALTDEYNRILNTTTFNGRKVFDPSNTATVLQGSYGANGGISVNLGQALMHKEGDGTFQEPQTLVTPDQTSGTLWGDFNGDGFGDLIEQENDSNYWDLFLSNGDGTFRHSIINQSTTISNALNAVTDIDGDGILDVYGVNAADHNQFLIFHGNGDGSFRAPTTITNPASFDQTKAEDFSGNGRIDLITSDGTSTLYVYRANGDGTFKAPVSTNIGTSTFDIADFNGDGIADYVATISNSSNVAIGFGRADGTFASPITTVLNVLSASNLAFAFSHGDFNNDGKADLLVSTASIQDLGSGPQVVSGGFYSMLGNGDGSFQAATTLGYGGSDMALLGKIGDFSNNGNQVISTIGANFVTGELSPITYFGNGDGTFRKQTLSDSPGVLKFIALDVNGDEVADALSVDTNTNEFAVALANTFDSLTV